MTTSPFRPSYTVEPAATIGRGGFRLTGGSNLDRTGHPNHYVLVYSDREDESIIFPNKEREHASQSERLEPRIS